MKFKDLLQGKPLGIPLHVVIVHFPIALFALSVVLDIASYAGGGNAPVRGAFYTLALGLIGAALAAVPGLADYTTIRADHPARRIATWHMIFNIAAVALYAISLGLRWGQLDLARTPALPFMLSIVGILIIGVSGYLGGEMVYREGIGVGRHRRGVSLPERTLHIDVGTIDASGFAPVVSSDALVEGQTVRVDVAGTVMAIVRLDGQVYAVQEFCTHRCGPLSEGRFAGGQVQCPWHNSRFDVRTGKVIEGPAKIDLKVFETQVRDSQIWVRGAKIQETPPRLAALRGELPAPAGSKAMADEDRDDSGKLHPEQAHTSEERGRSYKDSEAK